MPQDSLKLLIKVATVFFTSRKAEYRVVGVLLLAAGLPQQKLIRGPYNAVKTQDILRDILRLSSDRIFKAHIR